MRQSRGAGGNVGGWRRMGLTGIGGMLNYFRLADESHLLVEAKRREYHIPMRYTFVVNMRRC